jgi:hypothetical protein
VRRMSNEPDIKPEAPAAKKRPPLFLIMHPKPVRGVVPKTLPSTLRIVFLI